MTETNALYDAVEELHPRRSCGQRQRSSVVLTRSSAENAASGCCWRRRSGMTR